MNRHPRFLSTPLSAIAVASAITLTSVVGARGQEPPNADDIAAAMARAQQFTQPGDQHELMEKFLGEWTLEMKLVGVPEGVPSEPGSAEFSWLMEGRWMQGKMQGSLMGMPYESFSLMGYDNFKMSYVVTAVSSMDTAMIRSEGDLTQNGDALILYGTLDEYLTGEHDKVVKTVWRFESDDRLIMEVHDMAIGEDNTKVVEITLTRKEE